MCRPNRILLFVVNDHLIDGRVIAVRSFHYTLNTSTIKPPEKHTARPGRTPEPFIPFEDFLLFIDPSNCA